MLTVGYFFPMILLIGSLIVFKLLYSKCIETYDVYSYTHEYTTEPVTFPIWEYMLYIIGSIIPVLNWILLIALLFTLCDSNYFEPHSNRGYWYEITDETADKIADYFINKLDILVSKTWFLNICVPFVYLYKIMSKRV